MTLPKTLREEKTDISFTLAKESRYTFGEEPANRLQKLAMGSGASETNCAAAT